MLTWYYSHESQLGWGVAAIEDKVIGVPVLLNEGSSNEWEEVAFISFTMSSSMVILFGYDRYLTVFTTALG